MQQLVHEHIVLSATKESLLKTMKSTFQSNNDSLKCCYLTDFEKNIGQL